MNPTLIVIMAFIGLVIVIVAPIISHMRKVYKEEEDTFNKELREQIEETKKQLELSAVRLWMCELVTEDDTHLLKISDEYVEDVFSSKNPCFSTIDFHHRRWKYFRPFKTEDGCYYYLGIMEDETRRGPVYVVEIACFLKPKNVEPVWDIPHRKIYDRYMLEDEPCWRLKKEYRDYINHSIPGSY